MAELLNQVSTSDGYTDRCQLNPIGGVKRIAFSGAGGSFYATFWKPAPGQPGKFVEEEIERFYPGSTAGAVATGVNGVKFRSAVPGESAIITADMAFETDPEIYPGAPTTSVVVTPGGVITGQVNADGTIQAGSGFDVDHSGTGVYTITFHAAFGSNPTVLAAGKADATIPQVTDIGLSPTSVTIVVVSSAGGGLEDQPFNFVAFPTV